MKKLLLFTFLTIPFTLSAQNFSQYQKMISEDREDHDEYGNAVAIDGNYAIVGTKREDEDANEMNDAVDAGSAYILKRTGGTWTQEAKLVAADRESQDWFGHRVDISGTYAIAGAPFEMSPGFAGAGAAYIYERSTGGTWVQATKLEAPTRKSNDYFGFSVGISGDWAVVGAYYEDEDENETNEILSAGSAYVFKRNSGTGVWELYQKLVASDRELDDRFGMSIAIDGDQIIVGAEFDDLDLSSNGYKSNAGSAYVFRLNGGTWIEEAHINASDYGSSENFGWSVDISEDYAIVGAYRNSTDSDGLNGKSSAGAAYIYERGSGLWPQVKKIVATDRADIDYYGFNVAISGSKALVGAYRQNRDANGDVNFSDAGAAYIIERDALGEWEETQKITHTDRWTLDQFGFAVDIDGDDIIVGANLEDEDETDDLASNLPDAGSVFLFSNSPNSVSNLESTSFRVYPNPTNHFINIESKEPVSEYKLIDVSGRSIIDDKRINETTKVKIDISNFSEGLYSLIINNQYVQKISIVH